MIWNRRLFFIILTYGRLARYPSPAPAAKTSPILLTAVAAIFHVATPTMTAGINPLAGKKALADFNANQLPALEAEAAASGDAMQAQVLKNFMTNDCASDD